MITKPQPTSNFSITISNYYNNSIIKIRGKSGPAAIARPHGVFRRKSRGKFLVGGANASRRYAELPTAIFRGASGKSARKPAATPRMPWPAAPGVPWPA